MNPASDVSATLVVASPCMPELESVTDFCAELLEISVLLSLSFVCAAFAAWLVVVIYKSASNLP